MGLNFNTAYTDNGFEAKAEQRVVANRNAILSIAQADAPVANIRRNAAPTLGMK